MVGKRRSNDEYLGSADLASKLTFGGYKVSSGHDICGHCYGDLSADERLVAHDGMTVHAECEIVAIGHNVDGRDTLEWQRFMAAMGQHGDEE